MTMRELRAEPRLRASSAARLQFSVCAVDCTVTNLSSEGASLAVAILAALTVRVYRSERLAISA